ncbi:MAG: 16S rRNA (adenine(1518)-N(6)/adenine(1519)-N(6))-dimethyltransferase RsmA [Clostridia bacterium]|nr:16S rRNA (adenine(1518)-N(6)/adenine(1519)-N(6))-dimethyltransferase RsmA [Clostridia bacterium]
MKLTEISTIKALCEEYGFGFKKKFGQNFLVNARVPARIAESAEGTCALEIGPGIGTMTRELAEICPKVVAIEIDTSLAPLLENTLSDLDNVEVVFADAMKLDLAALCREKFGDSPVSVCANLPYYITTPIILHLLECGVKFRNITVMIQKEVADRLCARAGTPEYGAITLTCARYGKVKKLFDVPRSAFYPVPGVDSTVVTVLPDEKEDIFVKDEKALTRIIRASFNQRRKTLVNGMSGEFPQYTKQELAQLLVACGFREDVRGETLTLADFAKIVNAMSLD